MEDAWDSSLLQGNVFVVVCGANAQRLLLRLEHELATKHMPPPRVVRMAHTWDEHAAETLLYAPRHDAVPTLLVVDRVEDRVLARSHAFRKLALYGRKHNLGLLVATSNPRALPPAITHNVDVFVTAACPDDVKDSGGGGGGGGWRRLTLASLLQQRVC